MNCLCCGKPLHTDNNFGWHKRCIKRFFGTSKLPKIELDEAALELLATQSTKKGFTIPGVQKKLSLHLQRGQGTTPRLTLINYSAEYIIKPQVEQFKALPESEHLVMRMAHAVGIATVPHALIQSKNSYAYITKRIDRVDGKDGAAKLAMEDFCQLGQRLTEHKYQGSYERCCKIIEKYSDRSKLDLTEFFIRLVFFYITGNSDMHLKNFSLIETFVGSKRYVLSAAYDLLPVKVNIPADKEDFALAMNGKKTKIRKNDFFKFAESVGISKDIAEKLIKQLVDKKNMLQSMCMESLLPNDMKQAFSDLIEKRCLILMS